MHIPHDGIDSNLKVCLTLRVARNNCGRSSLSRFSAVLYRAAGIAAAHNVLLKVFAEAFHPGECHPPNGVQIKASAWKDRQNKTKQTTRKRAESRTVEK